MYFHIKKLAVLFLFFAAYAPSFAQLLSNFQNSRHLDNLSQNTVQTFLEDKNGFIWFGTESGLCRYDGRSVVTFNVQNASYFPDNSINALSQDLEGNIWVATAKGIGIFNPDNEVQHPDIRQLQDSINKKISGEYVNSICFFKNGTIAIGLKRGIAIVEPLKKKVHYFQELNTDGNSTIHNVNKIYETEFGDVFFLSGRYGIIQMDKKYQCRTLWKLPLKNNVQEYFDFLFLPENKIAVTTNVSFYLLQFHQGNSSISISKSLLQTTNYGQINTLVFNKDKNILLCGSNNEGLIVLDCYGNKMEQVKNTLSQKPLLNNTIYALLIDKKGLGYWIGSSRGLTRMFYNENMFTTIPVVDDDGGYEKTYPLYTNDNKILMAGTFNNLYSINLFKKTQEKIALPGQLPLRFYCIEKMGQDSLMLGTNNGLHICTNKNPKQIYQASEKYAELSISKTRKIFCVAQIREAVFLFGQRTDSASGIIRWDKQKRTAEIIYINTRNLNAGENKINQIVKTAIGSVIIATNNGLFSYSDESKTFTSLLKAGNEGLSFPQVNNIYINGETIWAATYGGGLNKYNGATKKMEYISLKNGLSSPDLYSIIPTNDSCFWISSNNGINCYNLKENKIYSYNKIDGLLDNEYDRMSYFRCGDTLYFGGLSGISYFGCKRITHSKWRPAVFIDGVYLLSGNSTKKIASGKSNQVITLANDAANLRIHLSVPFYINPEATKFYYRILPGSKDWIETSGIPQILLTGLKAGKHQLEVKAETSEGLMSSNVATLEIYVKPKWFQTLMFKVLMLLLTCVVAFSFYRIKISQVKKEISIRKKIAADLHDDLGGTLNSIRIYSHIALGDTNESHYLQKIKDGSETAVRGLKDLIWILDDKKNTVEDLRTMLLKFAAPLFESANIDFVASPLSIHIGERKITAEEKKNMYLIFKEAINNTIKYAGCKNAALIFSESEKGLQIKFWDNGKGIVSINRNEGNGLRNMKERAASIGCDFILTSDKTSGTEIEITKK